MCGGYGAERCRAKHILCAGYALAAKIFAARLQKKSRCWLHAPIRNGMPSQRRAWVALFCHEGVSRLLPLLAWLHECGMRH